VCSLRPRSGFELLFLPKNNQYGLAIEMVATSSCFWDGVVVVRGRVGCCTYREWLVKLVTALAESSCRTKEQYPDWWDVGERKEEGVVILVLEGVMMVLLGLLLEFSMHHDF